MALFFLQTEGVLKVFGDSQLLIEQVSGKAAIRAHSLKAIALEARRSWAELLATGSSLHHVYRDQNTDADTLASRAAKGESLNGLRPLWNDLGGGVSQLNNSTRSRWTVKINGKSTPLFSDEGIFRVKVARLALQQVSTIVPARWAKIPEAQGTPWKKVWSNLIKASLSPRLHFLVWQILQATRPRLHVSAERTHCPFCGLGENANTAHFFVCPAFAPVRGWGALKFSDWAGGRVYFDIPFFLGASSPSSLSGSSRHVAKVWNTLRCLFIVSMWAVYSQALKIRREDGIGLSGEPSRSPSLISGASDRVLQHFVHLVDFELKLAWNLVIGDEVQYLRRGGSRSLSSSVETFMLSWGRNECWASVSFPPYGSSSLGRHPPILSSFLSKFNHVLLPQRAWRMLDLCGGISTALLAFLASGRSIDAYWKVELDEVARLVGQNIINRLSRQHAQQLAGECFHPSGSPSLPNDISEITEEMIRGISPVDILIGTWPCTDMSGANRGGARGLSGNRSGLFYYMELILTWVLKYNPTCQYICENDDFSHRFPLDWATVTASLGTPVGMDAALVSYSHRWRLFWSSFFFASMLPRLNKSLHLNHVPCQHQSRNVARRYRRAVGV